MMRHTRIGLLAQSAGLGLAAAILLVSGLAAAASLQVVDLTTALIAPTFVDAGATYVVNVSYANLGWVQTLDNWVRVTVPEGTDFVGATYPGGDPRPPDEVNGRVLTWTLPLLVANSAWGHILITLQTDETLQEGETLTCVADIATSGPESDTSNNTASVTTTVSYMGGSFKQVQSRHTMPADVLDYTITINLSEQAGGGANGRWVTLTDTLPFSHQVRFLGWRGEITGTLIDGHELRWQGWVRAGETLSLQYRLGVEGVVTPGTVISNVAMLGWTRHQMQLGPVTTVVTVPHGVIGLGPYQGGQLHHLYGVTLTIPPGAITDTTRFQFRPLFTDTRPIAPQGGLLFAHRAFELNAYRFGEQIGQFNALLTITMSFSDTHVAGIKRETLRVWTREGPEGPWSVLDEPALVMSRTLTFTTTHLSQFALFGEAQYHLCLPLVAR
jgi:hypothetical protein